MSLFLKFKKNKGFTMIELLAVMAITAALAVALLANYRSGQRNYLISQEAQKLISNLRRAQNMAISGTGIAENDYYGYGIVFDQRTFGSPARNTYYMLYADENNNNRFNNAVRDAEIETINLATGVYVQSVSPVNRGRLDMFFRTPNPDTYFNGSDSFASGSIVLRLEGTNITRTISVNTAGLIE